MRTLIYRTIPVALALFLLFAFAIPTLLSARDPLSVAFGVALFISSCVIVVEYLLWIINKETK